MRLRQLYEDGRIVKGVNTTPDVDVNSISKEAAKFGFKVDKDGRPQNHPKKIKGSKTNVLFNLGMTESKDSALHISQALQLEKRAEAIWQRSVGRQFQWKSTEQKLRQIGKVIQAGQDPKKFIIDLNNFYNKYISFIQKNKLPNEVIRLLKQIQKLLVDNIKNESDLGLAESVAIKFERGDDYDILHIKEKGKNRVEVRGKSGYESGNYDPKDKLHKLLDGLKKAANISELMNGETVVINPKHPDGPKAIDNLTDLEEALGEIASATEIYVDMDGVLADFFGDWAKLMGVDNFRDIKDVEAGLQKIKDTEDFWLKLPVTANAKPLLELIKKVKGEYKILSSPLPGDPNSEPHKHEWIKKNLNFFPPADVIITHDKAKYATQSDGTPNILIDDYGVNIGKWEAAGGIGFKHKDHKFERTAKAIKQHMQEPVEEGNLFKNPANTFVVKKDTEYDFIKLGANMANLKAMPAGSNVNEPDIVVAPYAGKKEMKYLMKQLKRIGYKVQDAGGYKDFHYDEKPTGGKAPPQIKKLGPLGKIKLDKLKSVQSERQWHKLGKQLVKVLNDDYEPLQIDRKGRIVNGHHRYDALRLTGAEYARVHMVDEVLENMLDENFADGKKKGKSRPGRVKKAGASCSGSVTSLRKKAKKYSGEKGKMYHWCANMKGGKK